MQGKVRMKKKLSSIFNNKTGYAFVAPSLIFLCIFIFGMLIYAFYLSFYDWKLFDLGRLKTFVGLSNYINMLTDSIFKTALMNTLKFTFISIIIELVIGFFIALGLWNIKRMKKLIQSVILLPMITAPVIVGLIWRYIYDPQFGILNYTLNVFFNTGEISWLGSHSLAFVSIIIVEVWQMTPFVILVLHAGMAAIPHENLEAARVDGANGWKIVKSIVIPYIFPLVIIVLIMRTMDLYKIFDTVYALTKGGPGYTTETIALYTYKTGFSYYQMGYAMALSIVTLVFIFILSSIYFKKVKKDI